MSTYLALAIISAATLAYEVLLVRLFAIIQWHHFAFMAISIALLGFGASGTVLALWEHRIRSQFTAVFMSGSILFGLFAPASFLLAQALPFNALAIVWEPVQLLYLPAMYLMLVVPFFCAATCIGISFVCHGHQIGRIYAFNLVGSAFGALGVLLALFVLSPSDTLRLVAVLGFVSAAIVVWNKALRYWHALSMGSLVLAVMTWTVLPDNWLALQISQYKGLPSALNVSGARLTNVRSGPLGHLSVVESPDVPFRYVPGLSLAAPTPPADQLGIFTDGGSMTAITRFDGRRDQLAYLDYTTDAIAYHLKGRPTVMVLGAGGGRSVLQALYHQAKQIDAVELDTNMVRLVGEDHADYAGRIYSLPEVQVHLAEAREFVASSGQKWDLIQIPLLDSGAAAGVHGLNETYLYTVEAFEDYLKSLQPGGWLAVTRWVKLPPRDSLKLFATALDALKDSGVTAAEDHLVMLRGLNTTTLLAKNSPVSHMEIAVAKDFAEARSFDLIYYPGMSAQEANQYNVLDEPHFHNGAMALIGDGRETFLDRYKFHIAPATDERPYFFDFLKWRTLSELLAIRRIGGAGLLELGSVILAATLVQATLLSAVLILLPLWVRRDGLMQSRQLWRVAVYFLALGLAFLFVEIAFIQKFILFLGHPLYAVAVVIAGFLFFAGIGSGVSPYLSVFAESSNAHSGKRKRGISPISLAIAGIIAIALLYNLILPRIFEALFYLSDLSKIVVSLGLIAPLAFFMGMPFPLGLSRISSEASALVPWAWGVNGCASVLSVMLATLIAMEFGFSIVVLMAAVMYAVALVVFRTPIAGSS